MSPILGLAVPIIAIVITQAILEKKIKKMQISQDNEKERMKMLLAAHVLLWVGIIFIGGGIMSVIKERPKIYMFFLGFIMFILGCMLYHSCYTKDLF